MPRLWRLHRELPLIAVNHLEGHIHAVLLQEREFSQVSELETWGTQWRPSRVFGAGAGGFWWAYTSLSCAAYGWHLAYSLVGRTLDDAAGEAYDKVAKLLGLGYPGGPWIDALARFGDPRRCRLRLRRSRQRRTWVERLRGRRVQKTAPIAELDPHFLFSFSGIKTAVLRYVELHGLAR